MAPCMRLYAWLGQMLVLHLYEGHPYSDWIETYASPEFGALAIELEGLLDGAAEDKPVVRDAYRYAMHCERVFFAAPWQAAG